MSSGLPIVVPATIPHLSGRFAPVDREVDQDDLPVDGALPSDLTGAYLRNGPNPHFPPLGSYTYPMEGDGMLHGVWLDGGRARYRNRWVYTNGLRADLRAGRALFGGLMTPAAPDPSQLGPDPDPGWPFKLDAFINIVLDDIASEFPRIDDRRVAQPHRYVTTSRDSGRHELLVGEFDQLARHDMHTGATETYDADVMFGEVVFAPRDGATEELDGYYLTYATSPDAERSWLLVWDATTFPSEPVARVRMPQRVPHGLHGNWFPS
jgi:carotenoid cleavage dioxygenase-like enzyme